MANQYRPRKPKAYGAYRMELRRATGMWRGRKLCGARTVHGGQPCCALPPPGKQRCIWHGGLSSGPKTAAGKAKVTLNLPQYRAADEPEAPVEGVKLSPLNPSAEPKRPRGRPRTRPPKEPAKPVRKIAP